MHISYSIIITIATLIIIYLLFKNNNNQNLKQIKLSKNISIDVSIPPSTESEEYIHQLEANGQISVKKRITPNSNSMSITGKNLKIPGNFKLKVSGTMSN